MEKNLVIKIDRSKWKRNAYCEFFGGQIIPFYSVTFRLDVTELKRYTKKAGLSFYAGMIWITMKAINTTEEFLYEIHGEEIYKNSFLSPSYTYSQEDELFGINTMDWYPGESLQDFSCRMKRTEQEKTAALPTFEEDAAGHNVYISCLPWFDYEHVAQEFPLDRDDSTPRVLWGRYTQSETGKLTLPYTVQVNHRLIDGIHLAKLHDTLQKELDQFAGIG